jgi:hypothetical protein
MEVTPVSKELVVSTRFEALAEEFNEHDKQAGQSFVAMLNTQEEAKLEYQEATGKVHGFNEAWSGATGKPIKTVEHYNWLANKTVGLRKNSTRIEFSRFLTQRFLQDYASASPEAQELVEHELEQGRPVTPKQVREIDSGVQDVLEATDLPERQERMRKLSNHVSMPKNYNYTMNISTLKVTADSFANEEGLAGISAEELAGLLYRKLMFIQGKESNPVHMSMYRESLDNMEQMVNRLAEAIALLRSDSLIHSVN